MRREDKRLLAGAVCTISATFAAALLLPDSSLAVWSHDLTLHFWPWLRRTLSRKNVATLIQAGGAFIAFYGLLLAYTRAKCNRTPSQLIADGVKAILLRLGLRRQGVTMTPGTAQLIITGGQAVLLIQHNVDTTLPLQEQIERLAQFANDRAQDIAGIETRIIELRQELADAQKASGELERKLLEHIQTQIRELDAKIDRTQAIDLTWAIVGLLISGIGTLWGLGA